jgi:hypothetical protein
LHPLLLPRAQVHRTPVKPSRKRIFDALGEAANGTPTAAAPADDSGP